MKQRKGRRWLTWILAIAMIMTSMPWQSRAYAAPSETREESREEDPADVYCIYAVDGEEGYTDYELLPAEAQAPAGKRVVAKYLENGEYELLEEDWDLIILANNVLITGDSEFGWDRSDYILDYFRLYNSFVVTDCVYFCDEHFDKFSYPEGELSLEVLKEYYGDAKPTKRYEAPYYDYIVYNDWEISAILRARTLWIQEGAKVKTLGQRLVNDMEVGSDIYVRYEITIDGTLELAGGDARPGYDSTLYLDRGCILDVGKDGTFIGGSGENERGRFEVDNLSEKSTVDGIALYEKTQDGQYVLHELGKEFSTFCWENDVLGGIWVLADTYGDMGEIYSIYATRIGEDTYEEMELSLDPEIPEGKELIGKYVNNGLYTLTEEDKYIPFLANNSLIDASVIDTSVRLAEIKDQFRMAGYSRVGFDRQGIYVQNDPELMPAYGGEASFDDVMDFFWGEAYEGTDGPDGYVPPLPYDYEFTGDYKLREDLEAGFITINGTVTTVSHWVIEEGQESQGGSCITVSNLEIAGKLDLQNGNADEDKPAMLTIRDGGKITLVDDYNVSGQLTGDEGALLEFEGNAILNGIDLYEEVNGQCVPFELTGMRETFEMRGGNWVRKNGDPGPHFNAGEFAIEYDEFAAQGEQPKGQVLVNGTLVRNWEVQQFKAGDELIFTLVLPEERAGETPIVEIEVDGGEFYASTLTGNQAINIVNNSFTFQRADDKGFTVRVWWSDYDRMECQDMDHFIMETRVHNGSLIFSQDTTNKQNEPNGGSGCKRIYENSIFANGGTLTITIVPEEGAVLQRVRMDEGNGEVEYVLENPAEGQLLITAEGSGFTKDKDGNYVYTMNYPPSHGWLHFEADCYRKPFFNDMADNTFIFRERGRNEQNITITGATASSAYAFETDYNFETDDTITFTLNGEVYKVIAAPSDRDAFELTAEAGNGYYTYTYETQGNAGVEFQIYFSEAQYLFDQCQPNRQDGEFEVNYQAWNDGENAGGRVNLDVVPLRMAECDSFYKLIYPATVSSLGLTVVPNEGCDYRFTVDGQEITEAVKANHNYYVLTWEDPENIPRVEVRFVENRTRLEITKQPEDWFGEYGKKASFSVEAQGDGLIYAWQYRKSGNWINYGVTTWDTPNFKVTMNEKNVKWPIRCLITDAYGNTETTNEVMLKLKSEQPQPPVQAIIITKQPEDWFGEYGKKAYFNVEAEGEGLTYAWQYRKSGNWINYGVTTWDTPNFKVTMNEKNVKWPIRCLITDANGNTETTNEVMLRLKSEQPQPPADPITITTQPVDWVGAYGKKASFSVTATGNGLTYQWQYKKGTADWTAYTVTSYDTANFKVSFNSRNEKYLIRCLITDANGNTLATNEVRMRLQTEEPQPAEDPIKITAQPSDWYGTYGKKATFNVTAVSTTGATLTYQWQYKKGGVWNDYAIATADTPNFKVTMNEKNVKWAFRCVISDGNGNVLYTSEVWMRLAEN